MLGSNAPLRDTTFLILSGKVRATALTSIDP